MTIEQVEPGDMVQMKLTSGTPHTMIILYNVLGTVEIMDSNFSPPWQGKVSRRNYTYAAFKAMVSKYTIYRVNP